MQKLKMMKSPLHTLTDLSRLFQYPIPSRLLFIRQIFFLLQDGVDSSIFFLGGSGSGVSFHKHADAWNGVIFGRKRWFLYPPQKTPPGGKVKRANSIERR